MEGCPPSYGPDSLLLMIDDGWSNVHEVIGWFNCANLRCRRPVGGDHVTLLTTAHMRRFCDVDCVAQGDQVWHFFIGVMTLEVESDGHERRELEHFIEQIDTPGAPWRLHLERYLPRITRQLYPEWRQ